MVLSDTTNSRAFIGKIYTLIVVSFITFTTYAQGNVPIQAQELLLDGKKKTETACFIATNPQVPGDPKNTNSVLYRKIDSSGRLFERYEVVVYKDSVISISNAQGNFLFLKNNSPFIIKTPFKIVQMTQYLKWLGEKNDPRTEFSVSEEKFNNIMCYKVTVQKPTDDAYLAKVTDKTVEYIAKHRDMYLDSFTPTQTYFIGKSNHFIYYSAFYTLSGKRTYVLDWGHVDFDTSINNNIFEIPKGIPIKTAKDHDEFIHLRGQLYSMKKK